MRAVETALRNVSRTVLPNGLRIVTEEMPHVRSVAVGVWVESGSRHETAEENGISHFIEHMAFKGTMSRSAEEIACFVDAMGGNLDAFTMKESVAFTAKVLDEHLPRALEILSDLVLHPAFREKDISKEKGVVLEELKMDQDSPEYLIHEIFSTNFWKGHALGRPIIGNQQTITSFQQAQLRAFYRQNYRPSNLIMTAAGNLHHDELVKLVEERFGSLQASEFQPSNTLPTPSPTIVLKDKSSLAQVHLCLGVPTYRLADPRRYVGYVLNALLGGGVSSRLFLKIREREGLAYSVFSELSLYSDAGSLSIYAGTSLETARRVIECVLREFRDLREDPVSDAELRRAKDHLKGSLMLSLESTSSRMSNLARQEKYFGKFFSLDEINDSIERVSAAEVQEITNESFRQDRIALALLGNLNGWTIGREQLAC